jgi:hypothetical protein
VQDTNSHKGGVDKRCSIEAQLSGRQPVAVHADAPDVGAALDGAVEKLTRALEHAPASSPTAAAAARRPARRTNRRHGPAWEDNCSPAAPLCPGAAARIAKAVRPSRSGPSPRPPPCLESITSVRGHATRRDKSKRLSRPRQSGWKIRRPQAIMAPPSAQRRA